jgi:hypothetical protein
MVVSFWSAPRVLVVSAFVPSASVRRRHTGSPLTGSMALLSSALLARRAQVLVVRAARDRAYLPRTVDAGRRTAGGAPAASGSAC